MHNVIRDRMTHAYDGELVVFRVGLRVNNWRRLDLWLPPYRAMRAMLSELRDDPESGLLGATSHIDGGGPSQTQYWSSLDKLYAYAADSSRGHRSAWNIYAWTARTSGGAVGIWHETFLVDRAESMYVATPSMGLAAATSLVPARYGQGGGAGAHRRRRDGGERLPGTLDTRDGGDPLMRAIHIIGTVLLSVGFAMLAVAILIRDPTALDANIGAGGLSLIGIPLGSVGLVLVIVSAIARRSRRTP